MKYVMVGAPIKIKANEILENTEFVVPDAMGPTSEFAVTIEGDYKSPLRANRLDPPLPKIVIDCNYRMQGISIQRYDNGMADYIYVKRARGTGVHLGAVRQSVSTYLKVTECIGDAPALLIDDEPADADGSNCIAFNAVHLQANANSTILQLGDKNLAKPQNRVRILNFNQLFIHDPWDALRYIPGIHQDILTILTSPTHVKVIDAYNTYGVLINQLHINLNGILRHGTFSLNNCKHWDVTGRYIGRMLDINITDIPSQAGTNKLNIQRGW